MTSLPPIEGADKSALTTTTTAVFDNGDDYFDVNDDRQEEMNNPFALPSDDVFLLREREKREKTKKREMMRTMTIWEKTQLYVVRRHCCFLFRCCCVYMFALYAVQRTPCQCGVQSVYDLGEDTAVRSAMPCCFVIVVVLYVLQRHLTPFPVFLSSSFVFLFV
jgi:hypothetical protein